MCSQSWQLQEALLIHLWQDCVFHSILTGKHMFQSFPPGQINKLYLRALNKFIRFVATLLLTLHIKQYTLYFPLRPLTKHRFVACLWWKSVDSGIREGCLASLAWGERISCETKNIFTSFFTQRLRNYFELYSFWRHKTMLLFKPPSV